MGTDTDYMKLTSRNRIRALREEASLTVPEMATELRVHPQQVRVWQHQTCGEMNFRIAARIVRFFRLESWRGLFLKEDLDAVD